MLFLAYNAKLCTLAIARCFSTTISGNHAGTNNHIIILFIVDHSLFNDTWMRFVISNQYVSIHLFD